MELIIPTKCIICNKDDEEELTFDQYSGVPMHQSCISNGTSLQLHLAMATLSKYREERKTLSKDDYFTELSKQDSKPFNNVIEFKQREQINKNNIWE